MDRAPLSPSLLVQKYGGTSLATPERIRAVAHRILRERDAGKSLIVVVSAMGHSTDELISLAHQVAAVPSRREMDMLLTAGERISMALLSMCLSDLGADAISFTGSQSGIITSASHTDARIVDVRPHRIHDELAKGRIVIVAGFQGVSTAKEVTTLGRGGSDTTAVTLAAAFGAPVCEILTDVDGILTAHPGVVPTARRLRAIPYEEMVEMAALGAQVLHPRAAEMAFRYGVAVHVRSSFHEEAGTMVTDRASARTFEDDEIAGIAHEDGLALLRVEGPAGSAARVLVLLSGDGLAPRLIAQTPRVEGGETLAAAVPAARAEMLAARIRELGGLGVRVIADQASISVIGKSVLGEGPLLTELFQTLATADIPVSLCTTSALSASVLVPAARATDAVRALHAALIDAHAAAPPA